MRLDAGGTTDTASEVDSPDPKELHSQPETSYCPNTKKRLEFEYSTEHPFEHSTFITSVDPDRFNEKALAEILACSICKGIPTEAVNTTCNHIYCKLCITAWLQNASACPECRSVINKNDVIDLKGHLSVLLDTLSINCINKKHGCSSVLSVKSFEEHENKCKFGKYPKVLAKKSGNARGVTLTKIPIYDCNRRYLKQTRLKEALDSFSAFCNSHHENKTDVLFFMLHQNLLDNNDDRRHIIESLWKGQSWQLNPNQCLAMRIEILQSKLQYKAQYNLLKQMSHNPLQPPNALDAVEVLYTPPSARYSIEGIEYYENFYHTPAKKQGKSFGVSESSTLTFEPIDILNEFNECMPELATVVLVHLDGQSNKYPNNRCFAVIQFSAENCLLPGR